MSRKILIPLDGSEIGEAVIPKLKSLIFTDNIGMDVEIYLLQVIPSVNFNTLTRDERAQLPFTENDQKEMNQAANDYLRKIADKFNADGFDTKTVVRTGQVANEIVKVAREINADLIAMSTHNHNGIIRWAIGSISDKVMRLEGKIPVLAVNAGNSEHGAVIPLKSLQSLVKHS